MKPLFTALLLTFFTCSFSQSKTIKAAITNADSIWLVSHELTYQKIVKDVPNGGYTKMILIVEKGEINYKIIKEKIRLNDSSKNKLIKILTQPNNDSLIQKMRCFTPHHALIFFNKKKISFLDICFGCENFESSKGVGTKDIYAPKAMWKELEKFFLAQGIQYFPQ
jgi:hypothetical protein